MDPGAEWQDLYSSTSSDDQSSVNSVVHVDAVLDLSSGGDGSPRRQTQNDNGNRTSGDNSERDRGQNSRHPDTEEIEFGGGRDSDTEDGRYDTRQVEFSGDMTRNTTGLGTEHEGFMLGEDDSSSEDEEEQERRRLDEEQERARDSDSTSTSEDTQM